MSTFYLAHKYACMWEERWIFERAKKTPPRLSIPVDNTQTHTTFAEIGRIFYFNLSSVLFL
jgi:hypothetical protein